MNARARLRWNNTANILCMVFYSTCSLILASAAAAAVVDIVVRVAAVAVVLLSCTGGIYLRWKLKNGILLSSKINGQQRNTRALAHVVYWLSKRS